MAGAEGQKGAGIGGAGLLPSQRLQEAGSPVSVCRTMEDVEAALSGPASRSKRGS